MHIITATTAKAALATTAIAGAFLVGTGGVAQAAVTACPSNKLCAYQNSSFGGNMFPFATTDGAWSNNNQGEGFINDEASSFKNTATVNQGVWQDVSWGGPFIWCGTPNATIAGLGSKTDEASSHYRGDCNSH